MRRWIFLFSQSETSMSSSGKSKSNGLFKMSPNDPAEVLSQTKMTDLKKRPEVISGVAMSNVPFLTEGKEVGSINFHTQAVALHLQTAHYST